MVMMVKTMRAVVLLLLCLTRLSYSFSCGRYGGLSPSRTHTTFPSTNLLPRSLNDGAFIHRETASGSIQDDTGSDQNGEATVSTKPLSKLPQPRLGDFVRYYELDGGDPQGEVKVGKLVRIEKSPSMSSSKVSWRGELEDLEEMATGYYSERSWALRGRTMALRNLEDVSPLPASYVRTKDAYRVPTDAGGRPTGPHERYDLENYEGPPPPPQADPDVMERDAKNYGRVKSTLVGDAAVAGLLGAVVVAARSGLGDAAVYAAGALGGVAYLGLLTVKTDRLMEDSRSSLSPSGSPVNIDVSAARWLVPPLLIGGLAFRNVFLAGDDETDRTLLHSVSTSQFGFAIAGFLTYRIPLFLRQLVLVSDDDGVVETSLLPGSAGVALSELSKAKAKDNAEISATAMENGEVTVLMVSGPPGAGKTSLVDALFDSEESVAKGADTSRRRLVRPAMVDSRKDPVNFERLQARGELLNVGNDSSSPVALAVAGSMRRFGLTVDSIVSSALSSDEGKNNVVVIDADVSTARRLEKIPNLRLVGVWVGLDSLDKYRLRLTQLYPGEANESTVRSKMKEAVMDIEYGIVSGIFEFTILNDDFDESLRQLREAAAYCLV